MCRTLSLFPSLVRAVAVLSLGPLACGSPDTGSSDPTPSDSGGAGHGDSPESGAAAADAPDLVHQFPSIHLESGEELGASGTRTLCQVWRIGNADPVWVNTVSAENGGAFHHSNWFVYEESFTDADGEWWDCPATTGLGFGNVGIFFAMSTQAGADTQAFEPGAAFQIPPNAVIVGNLHLLNTSSAAVDTSMKFEVHTLEAAEVEKPLLPSSYSIGALEIPPGQQATAALDCVWDEPGVEAHYLLSHYHQWGTSMRVETEGRVLFDGLGEPTGTQLLPPIVMGSDIHVTCNYDNTSDRTLYWENASSGEMCMMLMYTTGRNHAGTEVFDDCTASGNAVRAAP